MPSRFTPQVCSGSIIFEGSCTDKCAYYSYEWDNKKFCVKVCPALYKTVGKTCEYIGGKIEQCDFYQDGKCSKECSGDYLTPSNASRNECHLICSNGEYFSDGICAYECDNLEYLGLRGNCHGCIDEQYDGGSCLEDTSGSYWTSDNRCMKNKHFRTRSTTRLQRKLTQCVESCSGDEFAYGDYECVESCSAKEDMPFWSVSGSSRVCVATCGD